MFNEKSKEKGVMNTLTTHHLELNIVSILPYLLQRSFKVKSDSDIMTILPQTLLQAVSLKLRTDFEKYHTA